MAKIMCAYYGDDPYDHDNRVSEWARVPVPTEDEEAVFAKKYIEQMNELLERKRINWYNIFVLEMTKDGVTSHPVESRYLPLRQRIVLNEAAKEDMLKAKTKRKSFDQVVEEIQAAPAQYAMFEQPVVNLAGFGINAAVNAVGAI